MKVAIQGLDASFHAVAARHIFGSSVQLLCYENFKDVFQALESGDVDYGVAAIENSLYGSINQVYDLLLQHNLWISGETYEEISLYLLGVPGTKLTDITDVYSHVAALGEAEAFLEDTLTTAERHEYADTAIAAQSISEWNDQSKVAIASKAAAEKFGLEILAKNIETHHHNYTRFIALSKTHQSNPVANKTSVTFRTPDVPGALHKVLGVFAEANANLTKLESRPIIGEAWQYMYYVDFVTAPSGKPSDEILQELQHVAQDIRVLGSYPADSTVVEAT